MTNTIRAAKKKREQRQRQKDGVTTLSSRVVLANVAPTLVIHGYLDEKDLENREAIERAHQAFVDAAYKSTRSIPLILEDRQAKLPEPKERQTYKAKPLDAPTLMPVLGYGYRKPRGWEEEAWLVYGGATPLEPPQLPEKWAAPEKRKGCFPPPPKQTRKPRHPDRPGLKSSNFQQLGNSGVYKRGGSNVVGNAAPAYSFPKPQRVKPIKQLEPEQLKNMEDARYIGLTETTSNPHFVSMDDDSFSRSLDAFYNDLPAGRAGKMRRLDQIERDKKLPREKLNSPLCTTK